MATPEFATAGTRVDMDQAMNGIEPRRSRSSRCDWRCEYVAAIDAGTTYLQHWGGRLLPDVPLASDDPLRAAKLTQAAGTAGMELVGADADLSARPSWPPSLKRVLALTITAELSTSATNFAAAAGSAVDDRVGMGGAVAH